jgi:hypothetical protein
MHSGGLESGVLRTFGLTAPLFTVLGQENSGRDLRHAPLAGSRAMGSEDGYVA